MFSIKKLIASILILFPLLSFASTIHIVPVLLDMTPQQKNTSFKIHNESDVPLLFQLKAMHWSQANGEDVQTETKDIIINPPVVNIEAGGYQLVRLGLRAPLNPLKEHSYRIIATQVPLKTAESKSYAIQTVMRFTLPLFISPKELTKEVDLKIAALPDGKLQFHLANKGNTRIKLTQVDFMLPDVEEPLATDDILEYVLAGEERTMALMSKHPKENKNAVLKLMTDWGLMERGME